MPLIALTGPTGVGKTHVQTLIHERLQISSATTITTRPVASHEHYIASINESSLIERVRVGDLVAPLYFGGHYYSWLASEILGNGPNHWLTVNVRPYTALLLASVLPGTVAIYLDVSSQLLAERRQMRSAERDRGVSGQERHRFDEEDALNYRKLFAHVMLSDVGIVDRIAELIQSGR